MHLKSLIHWSVMVALACTQLPHASAAAKHNSNAQKPTAKAAPGSHVAKSLATKKSRLTSDDAVRPRVVKASYRSKLGESFAGVERSGPASQGHQRGLHATNDTLNLASSAAIVADQLTGEALYEKNAEQSLPIASISKLMTALLVVEARQPLNESIEVTESDIPPDKYTKSKLTLGANYTRAELLQAALMSSDNRAAYALGRHYPGGLEAFVQAMNAKARQLNMSSSRFVEPTGLSSENKASPRDLVQLVRAAYEQPLIRQYTTSTEMQLDQGNRVRNLHNTNRLVGRDSWNIGLSKTGYIAAAGRCLVMQATVENRPVVMVFLDANGSSARIADAERVKKWLAAQQPNVDTARNGASQQAGNVTNTL